MKFKTLVLTLLVLSSFSLSYLVAQEAPTNENSENNLEEIWKDKWPEILATYNAISDERHRSIFSNYMHKKVGPFTLNTTDEYFIYNPADIATFEMKTTLTMAAPIDFLTQEIREYDRFFWDHIKTFLPMVVASTGYDPKTNILTVVVINPDIPGDLGKLDLNFNITVQGNNHILTLDPSEIAKIGGIKDNTITINVESLSHNPNYTVVTFHSMTHYKTVLWKNIEEIKEGLHLFELEDFLFNNIEKLCLETENNVERKYWTVTNQEVLGLIDFLKQDFIHYGNMKTDTDDAVIAKRDELLARLNELKTKILESNILEHFVAFNRLILSGINQKGLSTDWLDDYFPLLEGKRVQDLFLDDKESAPSLWAEAALYDAGLAHFVLLPYARRITQKYQLDNFRSLINSGYTSSTYYQEASLTDNAYAGGAFETIIHNEAFFQGYEPSLALFQLAQRVNQEYNFSAFVYFERWYPQDFPYAGWRLGLLRESLAVNNPYALTAFKAIVNLKPINNELFILATQVTTEEQAHQFEILVNEEVLNSNAYKKILEK